jgi:hypothetical protein
MAFLVESSIDFILASQPFTCTRIAKSLQNGSHSRALSRLFIALDVAR